MKRVLAALLIFAGCASQPRPAFVDGEQGRLFVSDGGSGSALPLVFVHGGGANLSQWAGQLAHFRKSRRAIAYDLRGMGRSEVPVNGDYSVAAMVEDLHRVVNALNVDRFALIGHSYGGAVAASYAAAHPERVAAVIYADAAGDIRASPQAWEQYLDALRIDKHGTVRKAFGPMLETANDEVRKAVYASVDRTSVEAFVGAVEGYRKISMAREVKAFKGPVLAIAAVDHENAFHVQFPHVTARRMSGVGHWLMMERPAEFNRIVEEFLAGVPHSRD